jgi:hypothetical protein
MPSRMLAIVRRYLRGGCSSPPLRSASGPRTWIDHHPSSHDPALDLVFPRRHAVPAQSTRLETYSRLSNETNTHERTKPCLSTTPALLSRMEIFAVIYLAVWPVCTAQVDKGRTALYRISSPPHIYHLVSPCLPLRLKRLTAGAVGCIPVVMGPE